MAVAHLKIELSDTVASSIDVQALCNGLQQAMVACGIFPLAGIRVRAYCAQACAIADMHPDNGFVAMTLSVGHGREKNVLAAAGEQVFAAAKACLPDWLEGQYFGLSLEIREIDERLTWKANTIRPRLIAEQGSE
ncbi:MAG: 5-carboxymethyl-2-hydroxymuconate Delta-isomerase [Sphingobium sp.]|nr:MAG: 5-carboxymethyl-2-hydroxymuconate Delta-isomerase [Sphingobium sp.]